MKLALPALLLTVLSPSSALISRSTTTLRRGWASAPHLWKEGPVAGRPLHMASSSSSDRSRSSFFSPTNGNARNQRGRKKSVRDRTNEEAISLVRDIVQAAVDAGPQAGPRRTLEAYRAFASTMQEFLPLLSRQGDVSTPAVVRTLFERLGATYIKLGQFIASSPTLFPKEYVVEFQKCLDQTEKLPWSTIRKVIEDELGPISQNFDYIDQKPLASASIAQVHAARLKTGEDVVLKVQKPGIDQTLKADLGFLFVAARVLEFLQPDWERTSLSAVAGDIRMSMLEELDFQKEAKNTIEFRRFLQDNDLMAQATAPRVYLDYTTKKVFTMERLDGVSLLDENTVAQVTKDPSVGTQTIINALNIWSLSVTSMPWFHADVHAGNLLLLRDGRVGFIDFGIVGRISEQVFRAVNELSTALALGDSEGMARALCNMGAADQEVDIKKFGQDIDRLLNRMNQVQPELTVMAGQDGTVQGRIDVDESEITDLLLELVEITENNGLKLPREFGLLVKQSLYFDRYLKILAPNVDVMNDTRVMIGGQDMSGEAPPASSSRTREVALSATMSPSSYTQRISRYGGGPGYSTRIRQQLRQPSRLFATSGSVDEEEADLLKWERMYAEGGKRVPLDLANMDGRTVELGQQNSWTEIRVVSFDLDNTLWNTSATISAANDALASFLDKHNIVQSKRVEKVMGDLFRSCKEQYCPIEKNDAKSPVLLTKLRKDAIKKVLIEDNAFEEVDACEFAEQAFQKWAEARHRAIPSNLAASGVLECLEEIASIQTNAGHPIVVGAITDGNSDPSLVEDLSQYFDFCINAERVGISKPDKRVYLEAVSSVVSSHPKLQDIKIDSTNDKSVEDAIGPWWVHIGDDFVKDVVAAKELRMRSIWCRELVLEKVADGSLPSTSAKEEPKSSRSVEDLVKEVSDQKVIRMQVGSEDYLTESFQKEFADATVDRFSDLGQLLTKWQRESSGEFRGGEPIKSEDDKAKLIAETVTDEAATTAQSAPKDTKYCMFCGQKLPVTAKFCSSCGEKQE